MKKLSSMASITLLLLASTPLITGLDISEGKPLSLVIISPHPDSIKNEFKSAFRDYYNKTYGADVDIQWIDVGGTSSDLAYIESNFAKTPDSIKIDLFYGGGVDPYIKIAGEGLLTPYRLSDEELGLIPNNIAGIPMYDDEYRWYSAALSGFGIAYNKAVIQAEGLPTPTTWEDLTLPIDKGWVGSADPRNSGSTHMAYEVIMQGYGWDEGWRITTLLGANCKNFPASSGDIPGAIGAGDLAFGLAIDYYAWSQVAARGADKIGYILPQGLTVVNPDSIAILKGAPNLEVAQRFISFVLSKQGQKLLMLPVGDPEGPKTQLIGRLCVIPELYDELGSRTVVPFNPFTMTTTLQYNATKGSIRFVILNDLIGAMIIDQHDDLVAAWTNIITINKTTPSNIENALRKLSATPVAEVELEVLALNWTDPQFRNQYITQWHTFAKQKYTDAVEIARYGSTREEIVASFQTQIAELKTTAQNNLYFGVGGGIVAGLIVGLAISSFLSRRRELAAVKK